MLEKILKLYVMAMAGDVRSPLPHLFGPPGCGKSTVAEQAAELLGVNLHIINVSRISPLELEGVQMPVSEEGQTMALKLLHATFWTQLKEGDILLLDEFLRAFPEVYNGLLDILTSRQIGGYRLPKVFIMAASNSTVAYDKALEDRLLHLPVPDPRTKASVKKEMAQLMVDQLGLLPEMRDSFEMADMLNTEVLPMYGILDQLGGSNAGSAGASLKGKSLRNLIGQAKLREIQSASLKEVIDTNNLKAMSASKPQFVLLTDGRSLPPNYEAAAKKLVNNEKLTEIQAINLNLNLQLIEMESQRKFITPEGNESDDNDIFDDIV